MKERGGNESEEVVKQSFLRCWKLGQGQGIAKVRGACINWSFSLARKSVKANAGAVDSDRDSRCMKPIALHFRGRCIFGFNYVLHLQFALFDYPHYLPSIFLPWYPPRPRGRGLEAHSPPPSPSSPCPHTSDYVNRICHFELGIGDYPQVMRGSG